MGGEVSDLLTGYGVCEVRLSRTCVNPRPLLGWLPRDDPHIGVGFPRQPAPARKPVANAPGSRIVGGCREPEVPELTLQVAQELCGVGNRFDWIEGVGKTARDRRRRHELRYALRPCAAYCAWIESALLPDQPGEEIGWQIIFCRCRRQRITDAGDGGRTARWRSRPGLGAFDRGDLIRFTCTRSLDQIPAQRSGAKQHDGEEAGCDKAMHAILEHDPEKWEPVFGKRSCSNKELERDDDSKKNHPALAQNPHQQRAISVHG